MLFSCRCDTRAISELPSTASDKLWHPLWFSDALRYWCQSAHEMLCLNHVCEPSAMLLPGFMLVLRLYVCAYVSLGCWTLVWMNDRRCVGTCETFYACPAVKIYGSRAKPWPSHPAGRCDSACTPEDGVHWVVGVVGTETNLGHDRGTRGCGNARLRWLHRLGWRLAEGLGGHNYRGLLLSHHSHGWCQGGLLKEERRDKQDVTPCLQQSHGEQEAGATVLLSLLVSWLEWTSLKRQGGGRRWGNQQKAGEDWKIINATLQSHLFQKDLFLLVSNVTL